jgi:hypothetical protein
VKLLRFCGPRAAVGAPLRCFAKLAEPPRTRVEGGNFALISQGFPQLVRVSSDGVRPDNSRVFPERTPIICQIRMVNETPVVPDLERLEEMIADETSIGSAA